MYSRYIMPYILYIVYFMEFFILPVPNVKKDAVKRLFSFNPRYKPDSVFRDCLNGNHLSRGAVASTFNAVLRHRETARPCTQVGI